MFFFSEVGFELFLLDWLKVHQLLREIQTRGLQCFEPFLGFMHLGLLLVDLLFAIVKFPAKTPCLLFDG